MDDREPVEKLGRNCKSAGISYTFQTIWGNACKSTVFLTQSGRLACYQAKITALLLEFGFKFK
jgi:hypothetical protein